MIEFEQRRVDLATDVALNVAVAGPERGDPIIFLHGFPESHRTWREQIAALSDRYFCVAPDQRGFARSQKPEGVENYTSDKLIADIFALADALDIDSFTLAGHDWGGAIAWGAAINTPARIERLIIANAPHPLIFQRALWEDREQRQASQYIRAFRDTANDAFIEEHGLAAFLAKVFEGRGTPALADEERAVYFRDWAEPGAPIAMLNWYRAARLQVPAMEEKVERPAILDAPFPTLRMPVLVIWGMEDKALLPGQIEALGEVVERLTLVPVEDAGHFVTWESPGRVTEAIETFLARRST